MAVSKNCTLQPSEVAAQYMEEVANNDIHGYSQPNRKGDGTSYKLTLTDGSNVDVDGGDVDCSEACLDSYRNQGINVGDATYTGNMDELLYTGNFIDVGLNPANWTRGDILWVRGHVATWLGNGMLAEAHHGDFPGGLDGWRGDQDGTEVRVRSYYDDGWKKVYHCTVKREVPKPLNGWIKDNNTGKWMYYKDGAKYRSKWLKWYKEDNTSYDWYYFGADGFMFSAQWLKDQGWYYFGRDGKMVRNTILPYLDGYCVIGSDGKAVRYGEAEIVIDDYKVKLKV